MAGGRPTNYKPEYCEMVIEWGKLGWSLAEMASKIGVSKSTLSADWPSRNPEFSNALKEARTHSEAWHARIARENYENNKFNTPLWSRYVASQFGWNEKISVDQESTNVNLNASVAKPDETTSQEKLADTLKAILSRD